MLILFVLFIVFINEAQVQYIDSTSTKAQNIKKQSIWTEEQLSCLDYKPSKDSIKTIIIEKSIEDTTYYCDNDNMLEITIKDSIYPIITSIDFSIDSLNKKLYSLLKSNKDIDNLKTYVYSNDIEKLIDFYIKYDRLKNKEQFIKLILELYSLQLESYNIVRNYVRCPNHKKILTKRYNNLRDLKVFIQERITLYYK